MGQGQLEEIILHASERRLGGIGEILVEGIGDLGA